MKKPMISQWACPVALSLLGMAVVAQAQVKVNDAPGVPDPAPTLNGGWAYDQVEGYVNSYDATPDITALSDASPYVFTLTSPATFEITDAYISGDSYGVYNGSSLILTSSGGVLNSASDALTGAAAWADPNYSHGSILLGAGSYSLSVESINETGVLPAGFFTELTSTVPDAGSFGGITSLVWGGMLALSTLRTKRSKK